MIPPNPFILARLFGELWLDLSRALLTPWTRYPLSRPLDRKSDHPAMRAPIERASDWEPEREGEVVRFRQRGGM
jgi:hypothetical protein